MIRQKRSGSGKFGALNLNTDGAGLSFGLIQWAQRPGRLAEIVYAFCQAGAEDFARIFGYGTLPTAQGLLAHIRKPNGGVDPASGTTTDPDFDLIYEPWVSRFRAACSLRHSARMRLPFGRRSVSTTLDPVQAQSCCSTLMQCADRRRR